MVFESRVLSTQPVVVGTILKHLNRERTYELTRGLLYLINNVLQQALHANKPFYQPAGVEMVLPDRPPEESFAAVAGGSAIVLSSGAISADRAVL